MDEANPDLERRCGRTVSSSGRQRRERAGAERGRSWSEQVGAPRHRPGTVHNLVESFEGPSEARMRREPSRRRGAVGTPGTTPTRSSGLQECAEPGAGRPAPRAGRASARSPRWAGATGAAQRRSREGDGTEGAVGGKRDGGHHGSAEASGDEGEHAGHLATLADEMRLHPRVDTRRQRRGAQVVTLPEHHQVEAVEVAHPDPPPRGRRGDRVRWRAPRGRRRAASSRRAGR